MYRKSGDSLMGRYFLYRMHPLSIGELLHNKPPKDLFLHAPSNVKQKLMDDLLEYGGFPEPYLKKDRNYYNRWQSLRRNQLFKEDIRDISRVQDLSIMEVLYE